MGYDVQGMCLLYAAAGRRQRSAALIALGVIVALIVLIRERQDRGAENQGCYDRQPDYVFHTLFLSVSRRHARKPLAPSRPR